MCVILLGVIPIDVILPYVTLVSVALLSVLLSVIHQNVL